MSRPLRYYIPPEQQTVPFSGDSRFLSHLHVYSKDVYPWENAYLSQSESMGLELGANTNDPLDQKMQDKITASLKLLSLREQNVIVQFWWPRVIGKQQLLTTKHQPFGIGVVDVGLCMYRRDSECHSFLVNKDQVEEDNTAATRVFRRELPEWSFDINSYSPKHFPQQACAILCGLHGYLGLPVFDRNTGLCVGVLEVLTSSRYSDYGHEVQSIHDALQTVNLLSPQVYDFPAQMKVPNEHRQRDLDKIFSILENLCDIYKLPLAQTWAISQHASYVAHENVIEKSCSSFDSRCVGKVCMSTSGLPFHVKDLSMWGFREECIVRHLDRSCGLVGKALLTRGSCFCGDVTKLSEQEYPLVHSARMNRLTGCFTIFLHGVDDYVLEFYLPPDMKEIIHVLNLVQTLNQNMSQLDSRFELGDSSFIENVGPLTDTVSDVTQTSSDCADDNYSSNLESLNSSVTKMVTARIALNDDIKTVWFSMSSGLINLKNKVARIFELQGEIRLKYIDEDKDKILITCDDNLKDAVLTNDSVDLICQPDPDI